MKILRKLTVALIVIIIIVSIVLLISSIVHSSQISDREKYVNSILIYFEIMSIPILLGLIVLDFVDVIVLLICRQFRLALLCAGIVVLAIVALIASFQIDSPTLIYIMLPIPYV